ncbi:S8 family serine peptidase [Planomicrobium sp. CPCC 101079]|uniref:S8 family serine peptidase n=1 Tax=Planomicrobium sp. CPCC 101079 TaxID=2599618 RepID=UPI0011B6D9D1|nr:S8 family serine peptidase [Planomicrobium sp. CPCC 101079]TWT03584.1 S8 family serine peptidase [Planomicrobium sp. CPCC 101079]
MGKTETQKLFNRILPLVLILSLLSPFSLSAAEKESREESDSELAAAVKEQLKLSAQGPRLDRELRDLKGDKEVAVIIHLAEKPIALEEGIRASKGLAFSKEQATDIKAKVEAQQTEVRAELQSKNISYEETHSYSTVLNGFSATVKAGDLKKMLEVPGVRFIEPDHTVKAMADGAPQAEAPQAATGADPTPSLLGVDKLWAEGIQGEGVKVAVLDTGIDPDHPEFKGVYKGGKNFVKFSATYTKPRPDNDPSETKPSERPANMPEYNEWGIPFATYHGTHVSGTIAAIGANEFGFKGMAPKVELYAYRVMGAYGSGQVSWVLAGIEEAAEQDMDVLNLSLGVFNTSESESMAYAVNNATLAGTTSVLAGGNFGPYRTSVGSPGTSRLGITVGNTTLPEERHSAAVNATVGEYKLEKPANLMATTFNEDPAAQLTGEYELVSVPEAGQEKDYEGLDVKGKVAVVALGRIVPEEKIRTAKAQGAVAVFLHNVRRGEGAPEASGLFIGDSFDFIPAFDLSQTDGEALRAQLKDTKGTVTFGDFKTAKTKGDEVHVTSSQGPSTPNFDIKPDVVAPGTRILSTKPMYKADYPNADYTNAYTRDSGTSMSAPHVTGIAALLKQAHPDWTPFDIKVAMSNTAKNLDKENFDVFAQGAGRVEAYQAAHPEALAYAQDQAVQNQSGALVDNPKGTVTFGNQSLKEKNLSVAKKILVKDITGKGGDYKTTVEVTKAFGDAKVTVDKPSFTLSGEQELTVTLTASKNPEQLFEAEILGYIHLTKGDAKLSLPFAANFSGVPVVEMQNFALSETDLSPNGDGVKDEGTLDFTLTGDLIRYDITLYDLGAEYGEGVPTFSEVGYLMEGNEMKKGKYNLPIDGQYYPWNGDPKKRIPDGVYSIQFNGEAAPDVQFPFVFGTAMPFFVKTSKPDISGSVSGGAATGTVTDRYLEFNTVLKLYALDFDLNDKLHATYIITRNGAAEEPVPFNLEQDGSFSVPVAEDEAIEAITVVVTDAAGNKGEAVIYQK